MAVISISLKDQLLSNFLEKSRNFGQLLKNFGVNFKKVLNNLWLRPEVALAWSGLFVAYVL